ncbi:MAG TPA: hypothetical protein V6C91_10340 [Coleofasciculaceae cyanobacterium]
MRYSNPLDTSVLTQTTKTTKPKLSMIWVKKTDSCGRECLVAVWTTQD